MFPRITFQSPVSTVLAEVRRHSRLRSWCHGATRSGLASQLYLQALNCRGQEARAFGPRQCAPPETDASGSVDRKLGCFHRRAPSSIVPPPWGDARASQRRLGAGPVAGCGPRQRPGESDRRGGQWRTESRPGLHRPWQAGKLPREDEDSGNGRKNRGQNWMAEQSQAAAGDLHTLTQRPSRLQT